MVASERDSHWSWTNSVREIALLDPDGQMSGMIGSVARSRLGVAGNLPCTRFGCYKAFGCGVFLISCAPLCPDPTNSAYHLRCATNNIR